LEINTKLTKQHFSTKVYKAYFEYFKLHHPNIDIVEICEKAGLPYAYVISENNWVSVLFDKQFTEECIKASGTADLCYHVGQIGLTKTTAGHAIYYLFKYARSLKKIYSDSVKYTSFFNKVMNVEIIGNGKQYIILKFEPLIKDLNQTEKKALLLNCKNIMRNTQGYFTALPNIKAKKNAKVTVEKEMLHHQPIYYLTVNYPFEIIWEKTFSFLFIPILSTLAYFFCQTYLNMHPISSIFIATILFFACFIYLLLKQYTSAKTAIEENEKNLTQLDLQYNEVARTKMSLQRKLKESQVINKITTHLAATSGNEDPMRSTCEELVKVLKYDRAIVLLADEDKAKLNYHTSYGLSAEFKEKVKNWSLEINIKNTDPNKMANVFRRQKPTLVPNVKEHLKNLEDPGSKDVLFSSGSKSFICVPIANDLHCFGIIIIDYVNSEDELEIDDLNLLTMVGKQAALFLAKDLAQKETIEAYRESNILKDQFLANTTHELKTPLHGIIGLTESLMEGSFGVLPKDAIANLQLISTSGKRLTGLVNNILDYSKMRHKKMDLNISDLNLYNTLVKVIANIIPQNKNPNVRIVSEIPAEEFFIKADHNRLQQIFFNLIGNAMKFTNEGEIRITAENIEDEMIQISVIDTGIGIPDDKIDKICDTFFQLENQNNTSLGGTGLGLSITKDLIKLHGGYLEIRSQLNKGTTISFTLKKSHKWIAAEKSFTPINFISQKNKPQKLQTIKNAEENVKQHKETILIVDDEPINIRVLEAYLKNHDFNIITAENGQIAVDLVRDGACPDMILLDIMMPVMNGHDACIEIRKLYSETELPIIFLTAKREDDDLVKAFSCGANDYLTKPFSKIELLARLKSLLSSSRLTKAYSRFVPWSVLEILDYKSILDVKLGDGINREMTVLFIDIRNFTSFCEDLIPSEILNFINSYLARMSPIMHRHNGIIDKFIGDCIMVTFVDPQDAVNAGGELLQTLWQYNLDRLSWGWGPIEVGIGVHTGPVVIGPIGYEGQLAISVMADSVNIASRIEQLTKALDSTFIISQQTFNKIKLPSGLLTRPLGPIKIKGKKELVSILELFPAKIHEKSHQQNKNVEDFINRQNNILIKKGHTIGVLDIAIAEFVHGDFTNSLKTLNTIDNANKDDKAVQYYIALCKQNHAA